MLICEHCDYPLAQTPLATKQLSGHSADMLILPTTGATRLLDRMKLRLVVADEHKLDIEIIEQLVLGRASNDATGKPDVDLSPYVGENNALGVSRFHALIRRVGMSLTVADHGSTNGTWLNGQRLTDNEPHFIHDGDTLFLGHLQIAVFFIR